MDIESEKAHGAANIESTKDHQAASAETAAADGTAPNASRDAVGLTLAIDCSTSSLTVALLQGARLVAERTSKADRNHSLHVLPFVQQLLAEQGFRPMDLASVAVGQGPGSYTGVRIAVTAAKTLAWSLGIPLLAVSSLEAMAWGAKERLKLSRGEKAGAGVGAAAANTAVTGTDAGDERHGERALRWFIPLMDARRVQAFTAIYAEEASLAGTARLVLQGEDGIRKMQDWTEALLHRLALAGAAIPQEIVFAGETGGFLEQIEAFDRDWPLGQVTVLSHDIEGRDVGAVAYLSGEASLIANPHDFVPNYAQLTEAEVNLQKKTAE